MVHSHVSNGHLVSVLLGSQATMLLTGHVTSCLPVLGALWWLRQLGSCLLVCPGLPNKAVNIYFCFLAGGLGEDGLC